MKKTLLALLLLAPAVTTTIRQQDPIPICFPCPPTPPGDTRGAAPADVPMHIR